jgi:hypothetical protein
MIMRKLVIAVVLVLSIASYALASDQNTVYLPLIVKAGPTASTSPVPTITPTSSVGPTITATTTATATATPTATPIVSYEGVWQGTTSQGTPITFTVVGSGIQSMTVDYSFDFGSCMLSGPVSFWRLQPIPFSGTSFSVNVTSRTTVAGTFESMNTASGTLQVVVSQPGCNGTGNATWTATKP